MKTQFILFQQHTLKNLWALCFILIFSFFTNPINAQSTERTVTGVVSCTDGLLPQATVLLKGTTIGTYTDDNGAFKFPTKLKENDVLLITYLGYKDAEVTITKNTTFIKPFLEDISLVIVADLRTKASSKLLESTTNKN